MRVVACTQKRLAGGTQMNLLHQIWREICHRKGLFLSGVLAIALCAGISSGSLELLRRFDAQTVSILTARAEESRLAWERFKDNVRKTMLELGFNLIILPQNQTLSTPDEHAEYLPESYAQKLREAHLMSINHVLPFLQKKVWWPEGRRWITIYGTPGEIQIKNPKKQTPMVNRIEAGEVSLGRGIYAARGLKEGDTLKLMGRKFIVQECRPGESFEADEQIRMPLETAQELLKLPGKISGLMAVNCVCSDPLGVANIRDDIATLLPGTKVLEHKSHRVVRVEERARVAREADAALDRELRTRARLRQEQTNLAATLIPLVTGIAAVWLGLLSWLDVRRRLPEMAVLHAIGWHSRRVLALVLFKAAFAGLIGGVVGAVVGIVVVGGGLTGALMLPCIAIAAGAVLLAVVAGWIPALQAAMADPAKILQEEG